MGMIERPGTYTVSVKDCYLQETKTGKLFVAILFEDVDTEDVIWHNLYCTPGAWKYTLKALQTMGWDSKDPMSDIIDLHSDGDYVAPLVGAKCEIEVDYESWVKDNGEEVERCRVKWINPVGGRGAMERLGRDDIRKKAAKLKLLLSGGGSNGKASRKVNVEEVLDDVPF